MVIQILIRGLTILFIPLIVKGIIEWNRNRGEELQEGIVKLPKNFLIVGSAGVIFFGALTMISTFIIPDIWASISFFFFSLFGSFFIIAWLQSEIIYDEKGVSKKNIFGVKRIYSYSDITNLREGKDSRIYFGKHSIFIDESNIGGSRFIDFAKLQYASLHAGSDIPKAPKSWLDPFNGHVSDFSVFVFFYVLVYILTIGIFILIFVSQMMPLARDNLVFINTSFSEYRIEESELILESSESGLTYKMSSYDKYVENTSILFSECNGKTFFDVYSIKYNDEEGNPYYLVMSLEDHKGNVFLSIENSNKQRWNEWWGIQIFLGSFVLLWTIYVTSSICVGRNPEKFSKETVQMFFKGVNVH